MFNIFGTPAKAETPVEPSLRQVPAGQIENDGFITSADQDLIAMACVGWALKQQIDDLQKQLKAITDRLQASLGAGAALAVDGVCRVTVSNRQTFKLVDPGRCEALLGGRFADLVSTSVEYTPTDKLKEMVLDGDHPLSEGLRGCFVLKDSTSVTFRPGKAL